MDALSTARYGMMNAVNKLDAAAGQVAAWNGGGADIVQISADEIEAQQQFAASAKVVTFADEMWRDLMAIQQTPSP